MARTILQADKDLPGHFLRFTRFVRANLAGLFILAFRPFHQGGC